MTGIIEQPHDFGYGHTNIGGAPTLVFEEDGAVNRQEALHWLHQQLAWERRLAELRRIHALKSAPVEDEDEPAAA